MNKLLLMSWVLGARVKVWTRSVSWNDTHRLQGVLMYNKLAIMCATSKIQQAYLPIIYPYKSTEFVGWKAFNSTFFYPK